MSKRNEHILKSALLVLMTALVALVLGVTIVAQRERSLADSLHDWPAADAGYETFLRPAEEGQTPLTMLILEDDPEALFLVATSGRRMWVMELPHELLLREGEELRTLEELRARGLPSVLQALTGACALPVERCVSIRPEEPPGPAGLQGGSSRAGWELAGYGTLWKDLFTPRDLVLRHRLQADLAGACRVDPCAGYRTLQAWGEELSETASVSELPPPTAGWREDSRELDGPACMAMFGLMLQGDEALAGYLSDYRAKKEAERKLHTLSWDPVPPAVIYGGNASRMEVAITLDDGWNMDWRILDLLDSYGIDCTVFPIGRGVADRHPEWLQAMDAMGWEVANHTYTHPINKPNRLIDVPNEAVLDELVTAQQIIYDVTGKKYPYFRPPGGWVDERVAALAGDLGYITIMWSLDSGDTGNPDISPLDRANTILQKVQPGYILLFHFGGHGTYETLKYLVPEMLARGYHFVTLSQLFQP